jgi:hypothetical protein
MRVLLPSSTLPAVMNFKMFIAFFVDEVDKVYEVDNQLYQPHKPYQPV